MCEVEVLSDLSGVSPNEDLLKVISEVLTYQRDVPGQDVSNVISEVL